MDDIAALNPYTRKALFLPRDEMGRLVRGKKDERLDKEGRRVIRGKRMSLKELFWKAHEKHGLPKREIEERWKLYEEANPNMGKGGRKGKRRRR